MKIFCPQCNTGCELPSPAHGDEKEQLRCDNCQFLIISDGVKMMKPARPSKPVRRIIVLPSTKPEAPGRNRELARPDLLEKAKMLVATKNDVEVTEPLIVVPDNSETNTQVQLKHDVEPLSPEAEPIDELQPVHNKSKTRQKWLNIAAVIGAVMIFGGGLMVRDRVVSVLPNMAGLFKLAGYNVNASGLEFASVTSKTVAKNGGNILIIEGMIRNISGNAVKVPAVRLLMRAADKQEIYSWFHEPEQMRLQAGETLMFTTQLFGPPLDVQDIHLKFTERRKQQAKLN